MEGDRYQRDTAKFFGQEQDARSTGSVFHANKAAFFGEEKKTGFQIAAPAQTQAGPTVNTKSGVFKKDTAGFYGADKWEASSQGTNFQRNAAAFLGTDMPNSGERPFKIEKTKPAEKPQGGSYLNAQRLHEHVSDPKLALIAFFSYVGKQHAAQPQLQEEHEEIPRTALRSDPL